jgi:hypothetical protein
MSFPRKRESTGVAWVSTLLTSEGHKVATPSPGPPRLMKTPAAGHPLPQGGRGRKLHEVKKAHHKFRNSKPPLSRG